MNNDKILYLKDNLKLLERDNQVILGNRENGKWLKISKECMDILKKGIDYNYTVSNFLDCFADELDKKYFNNLFDRLKELDVISYIGEDAQIVERKVDFAITHRCNLRCTHCCVDADALGGKEYLSTKEIINSLDKIVLLHPTHIILTGGEAMVRKDFFEILEYLHGSYDGQIVLMTNSTLIDRNNADSLVKYLDAIDISLDGIDEESCSKIRGKNVFNKVIGSIRLLQECGFDKISLSMVMTKENLKFREQFKELNRSLGTRAIPRAFSPIGRGENNEENLSPAFNYSNVTVEGAEQPAIYTKEEMLGKLRICHCSALNKTIYINYKGDIFPCPLFEKDEYLLGNILEIESMKYFYDNKTYKDSIGNNSLINIQPDRHVKCKDCDVNLFCWNCLHFLDIYGDNDPVMKIRCKEKKRELQEAIWG